MYEDERRPPKSVLILVYILRQVIVVKSVILNNKSSFVKRCQKHNENISVLIIEVNPQKFSKINN